MAEKKRKPTRTPSEGWSPIFRDVAKALGFGPIVDRKKDVDKDVKDAGG